MAEGLSGLGRQPSMIHTVLIASRGEVAIRIGRACAALGLRSVAVFATDDPASLHVRRADASHALPGGGEAAYRDVTALIHAAQQTGCDAVHPGDGCLSEDAGFARACEAAGLIFVGSSPDLLALFDDRMRTRQLAAECNVPTPGGSDGPVGLAEAVDCLDSLGPARHVGIQIIGDGQGGVTQVGERDCTLQRCQRTLIEVAPSPGFQPMVRARMAQAAVAMARRVRLRGLCTFEFLLSASEGARFVFIGAKPWLQAEHTVTEEVFGVDLVAAQFRIAGGATLGELGLSQSAIAAPRGCAIQLRVRMEAIQPEGDARRTGGRIAAYEPPSGPGLRVDGCGYGGYVASTMFDGLLAKVIVRAGTFAEAIVRADRALREFRVDGVATNIGFLRAILRHPDFVANRVTTRWLDMSAPALLAAMEPGPEPESDAALESAPAAEADFSPVATISPGTVLVSVPVRAALLTLKVAVGDDVRRGQQLAILEAMTLQHVVTSPIGGVVFSLPPNIGDILQPGQAVALIAPEQHAQDTAVLPRYAGRLPGFRQLAGLPGSAPAARPVADDRRAGGAGAGSGRGRPGDQRDRRDGAGIAVHRHPRVYRRPGCPQRAWILAKPRADVGDGQDGELQSAVPRIRPSLPRLPG